MPPGVGWEVPAGDYSPPVGAPNVRGFLSKDNMLRPAIRKPRASHKRPLDLENVLRLLRSEVERAGSQSAFAKKAGVDRATVNRILHGVLPPSLKIVDALGLRVAFIPK
jgi:DNA-binding XRE family transcriptional regulator